jgi:DNA-binding response OmpR family regulator
MRSRRAITVSDVRLPPRPNLRAVLIVDDDRDIAESIGDVLGRAGYEPVLALDGSAAVRAAERHPVGLVLLDWRLPEEPSGAALVRQLRDACGKVPVVVLSADPRSLAEAREAQVEDYLPKPFEIADLLHLVDHYCV